MATAAANMKKRKPDQDSDHLVSKQPISYIPKHDAGDSDESESDPTDPAYVTRLLEPLTREQLIALLRSAALAHPPTLAEVRRTADLDPSHRKIFVHGLDWSTTADSLRLSFSPFGPIDDVRIVTDKSTGKSKGYGFILFRTRRAAQKALEQPQKLIDGRMTSCQLASVGPTSGAPAAAGPAAATSVGGGNSGDNLPRKVFVGNVQPTVDPGRLRAFFAQFGEIEEGPLGFDRATGKPKGFALFVYKTLEGARRALEEPSKNFEGHMLVCQRAADNSNRVARGPTWQSNPIANANPNGNANPNPNHGVAQNVAVAPGNVGQGYPGPAAAVPDMTAFLAQGFTQPNALLAVLAAAQQNQGAFGLNPALLASLNPAALAAAFGGASAQNVASGVQGYGGMGSVGYQQNVGGFQAPTGFQGPPGFQNAAPQVGVQQAGVAGSGGSYTGQAQSLSRPSVGQMGAYGHH